jgi:hypothetical protein
LEIQLDWKVFLAKSGLLFNSWIIKVEKTIFHNKRCTYSQNFQSFSVSSELMLD